MNITSYHLVQYLLNLYLHDLFIYRYVETPLVIKQIKVFFIQKILFLNVIVIHSMITPCLYFAGEKNLILYFKKYLTYSVSCTVEVFLLWSCIILALYGVPCLHEF